MKKYLILLGIGFLLFWGNSFQVQAIAPKTQQVFEQFTLKVNAKLSEEKQVSFYKDFAKKIEAFQEKPNVKAEVYQVLQDFKELSFEKAFEKEYSVSRKMNSQKNTEASLEGQLQKQLSLIQIPSFLGKISQSLVYRVSDTFEFVEGNTIKKFSFQSYYKVNSGNISSFSGKKGVYLVSSGNSVFFIPSYQIISKIPYSKLYGKVSDVMISPQEYILDSGVFWTYHFKNFLYFKDEYGVYEEELAQAGIPLSQTLVYLGPDGKYYFVQNFEKVRLIQSSILFGIPDKGDFLLDLINDKKALVGNTDADFLSLQKKVGVLTKGLSREEKIEVLYALVLENLEYTNPLDLSRAEIFSGILSYKNKDGVCEGYVKLFSYALKFAGVSDAHVLRGDVIDAQDFPEIGHAWIQIGNLYYDPTFDDPIGNTQTKKREEYKYFGLPRDLLYANRYDYGTTPEYLKTQTLEQRVSLVNANLTQLSKKYSRSNYLVLAPVIFRQKYGLQPSDSLGISQLKNILPYFELFEQKNGTVTFLENGKTRYLSKLQYYPFNIATIESVFEQRLYDISGMYVFLWHGLDGTTEYRIAFDVKYN